MPVSPCSCASFSSSLCQCLLVLEWVSPCSCASFSSSFASFFLSLQGFLLFPVSHCPPAGFSLSSGLISSCPYVGFSLSVCQFLLIHILVSSRSGSSSFSYSAGFFLCQFLLHFDPFFTPDTDWLPKNNVYQYVLLEILTLSSLSYGLLALASGDILTVLMVCCLKTS